MKYIFTMALLLTGMGKLAAQTNVSVGPVFGTWKKTGSPYRINGQISVPKDSLLKIEAGVRVEFQGAFMLHVYGAIQAIGKPGDSVVFTAANKTTGWRGVHAHRSLIARDSIVFRWCRVEFVNKEAILNSLGAIILDTISNFTASNCLFANNKANYGSAITAQRSKLDIQQCAFLMNQATSSNTSAISSGGSAINTAYCTITILKSQFIQNECRLPKYALDSINSASVAVINSGNDKLKIDGCRFYKNRASGTSCISLGWDPNTNIEIINSHFKNNYSSNGSTVATSNINTKTLIMSKDTFVENVMNNNDKDFNYTVRHNFRNSKYKLEDLVLVNNLPNGLKFDGGEMNSSIIQGSLVAVDLTRSNHLIMNCIFTNNILGLWSSEGANALVVNSIIAYNGSKKYVPDLAIGGLYMVSSSSSYSTYSLINSIVQKNINPTGMANLLGGQGGEVIKAMRNSVIEGGIDSAKFYGTKKVTATTISSIYLDTVVFIKGPSAIGPLKGEYPWNFRPFIGCNSKLKMLNSGLNTYSDIGSSLSFSLAGTTDLDGNPRIALGTVDIGPYEIQTPVVPVVLTEPQDTARCQGIPVNIVGLSATADSLSYQWQYSSTGSSWSNINGANSSRILNYLAPATGNQYLRCIVRNPVCNTYDTSRTVSVMIYPTPQPNLGPDASIANNSSKLLNPGTFNSYTWSTGATTPTLTVDKNNLSLGANSIWVQVKDANNCQNRDTVIITLEPASRVESPEMAGIRVYPVPTDGLLNVQLPTQSTGTWQLTTTDGRLMQQGNLEPHTQINMKTLPAGIYLFSMEVEGKVYGMRVVR